MGFALTMRSTLSSAAACPLRTIKTVTVRVTESWFSTTTLVKPTYAAAVNTGLPGELVDSSREFQRRLRRTAIHGLAARSYAPNTLVFSVLRSTIFTAGFADGRTFVFSTWM